MGLIDKNNNCVNSNSEILNCDNNYCRACPVMLCNYEKSFIENKKIFDRNFGEDVKPSVPYRTDFTICGKKTDLNKGNKILHKKINKKITCFKNISNKFIPGKGPATKFLENIDIDSELKGIDHRITRCPSLRFTPYTDCKPYYSKNIDSQNSLNLVDSSSLVS